MPVAEIDGATIAVTTEFRDKELIKQVPGATWDTAARTWRVPVSWAACVQLRGVFGADLHIGPQLNAWAAAEQQHRVAPAVGLRTAADCEELAFMGKLRPFQRAGARFLTLGSSLMGDEMRLGKTVQAIAALSALGNEAAFPALVVCPNGVKQQWANEFGEWAPDVRVAVVRGGAVARRKIIQQMIDGEVDVLVMNYEQLRFHSRLQAFGNKALTDEEKKPKELNEITFQTVVADEAHRVLDPNSKQTRALWWIGDHSARRWMLTGTPGDKPEHLWAMMRFVAPPEFPTKTAFVKRYALESWNNFGFREITGLNPDTKDELFRIVDPRFIRRTREMVLPQLPPKIHVTRLCEMAAKQKKAYEEMRKDMVAELESGFLVATDPLTRMTRLLQFASAYGELGEPEFDVAIGADRVAGPFTTWNDAMLARATLGDEARVRDLTPLKLTEPSCKVDELVDACWELDGAKAVVFAQSVQLIELAAKRLAKEKFQVVQVTGNVPELDRVLNVRQFQEGGAQLILVTLGAGGEGLTLSAAEAAIFMQRSWSSIQNNQAEDRVVHIDRKTSPLIIDLVTEGTAEERVHAVRAEKAERLEEYARDAETLAEWLAK